MADTVPPGGPLVVNIWELIYDPDVPGATVQRAFARQRARACGTTPPAIPAEDVPFLARHARPLPEERPRAQKP